MTPNETERLRALHGYRLLDTPPDPEFDRLVKRAAEQFDVPIALMSLVDAERQWFKAKTGLEADETPRSVSFCSYAIEEDAVMVVPDARLDSRFEHNPLVTDDPSIRFYAGAPIVTEEGARIGTICIIDREPRDNFHEAEKRALSSLSREASRILAARKPPQEEPE